MACRRVLGWWPLMWSWVNEKGEGGAVILICFFSEMQARSFSQSPVIKRYQQFLYFLLLCVSVFSLNKNFTLDKKRHTIKRESALQGFFFFLKRLCWVRGEACSVMTQTHANCTHSELEDTQGWRGWKVFRGCGCHASTKAGKAVLANVPGRSCVGECKAEEKVTMCGKPKSFILDGTRNYVDEEAVQKGPKQLTW